jgi:hypothetical protein
MKWYHYIMCLFGGVFLANFVPHFTRGISGASFPSPFNPPGQSLSPAPANVLWGLANLAVAYVLLRYARFSLKSWPAVIVTFIGALAMSVALARMFATVLK